MKWLVVSSHDERYDFNLYMSIFNGTKEEFEQRIDHFFLADIKDCEEINGVYHYHKAVTREFYLDDKYDTIHFGTIILIPFDKLMEDDFSLYDPIVSRNVKFGFIDLKDNR